MSISGLSPGANEPLPSTLLSVADFNEDGKPDLALLAAPASATGSSASTVAEVLPNGAPLQFPVLLGGVVNAASGAHGGLSPGSLASAYMLPQPFQPVEAGSLPLLTRLDGVILLIGDRAPLGCFTLVTPAQSYPSPWGIHVATFSPGIFTMSGQGKG